MNKTWIIFVVFFIAGCTWGDAPIADSKQLEALEVVAANLSVPWDVEFVDEGFLVTERTGDLVLISGSSNQVIDSFDVSQSGEAGLLGITKHPDFDENNWIYLYLTRTDQSNEVLRFTYSDASLSDEIVIFDDIPGARFHDGGAIRFGPTGFLYVTVGDATDADQAQNPNSLQGSILRLNDDGSIPEDNPFGSAVYSYGHRNPQGITWHNDLMLSTEHGRSGFQSGMDEVNSIEAGNNYGWPAIEGDESSDSMISPLQHSGPDLTWAPASATVLGDTLYFGGLRGQALYAAEITQKSISSPRPILEGFGRIRAVRAGRDGMLYVTTSNTDGRGTPADDDDKLLRLNPELLP